MGWPVTTFGQWEVIDLNPTVSRQLGLSTQVDMMDDLESVKLRNPWFLKKMFTLAGSSRCYIFYSRQSSMPICLGASWRHAA